MSGVLITYGMRTSSTSNAFMIIHKQPFAKPGKSPENRLGQPPKNFEMASHTLHSGLKMERKCNKKMCIQVDCSIDMTRHNTIIHVTMPEPGPSLGFQNWGFHY